MVSFLSFCFFHSIHTVVNLCLFCFISLPRYLSILFIFLFNQLLGLLIFSIVCFLFHRFLLFIISFFLIVFHLICCLFHFLRQEVRPLILLNFFSVFLSACARCVALYGLGLSSSCGKQGLLFSCGAWASLWWFLLLRSTGSRHRGFSSCSTQAQ